MDPAATTLDGPSGQLRNRTLTAWIALAALGSFIALAAPFFQGCVYVADDLGEFHLPLRNFYAQQLAGGESFDWMPSLYGGFYVTGEGQLGAYHPLHLALYRLLPLGAAFNVELLINYPAMFVGMFLFLRALAIRSHAAAFGGLAFTFCGFNLLHFIHPNAIAIVAHIPWLLLAIELALVGQGWRRATAEAGISLLTASQLLLGYPQYVWFSLLIEAAYAAWRCRILPDRLARLAALTIALGAGVLIGALQWIPTLDALEHSVRRQPDAAFANTGSLHPWNLVQLVAPYLLQTRVVGQNTHELGLYFGAVPLMLCVWLLTQRARWRRFGPLIRALCVFASLALLLAMGSQGGLYRLQSLLPIVNQFRFPCRAIVLVQLCTAAAAAVALALLTTAQSSPADPTRSSKGRRALLIAFFASIACAIAGPIVWPEFVAQPWLIWSGPALFGSAAFLVVAAERGSRWALLGLVAFTALDLSTYGLSYSVQGRTADLHEFVTSISLPPGDPAGRVVVEKARGARRSGDRMLLAGLARVDGYAGLEPAKHLDYNTTFARRLAGVHWVRHEDASATERRLRWTPVESPAPRARLVSRAIAPGHEEASAPPLEVAVVDEPLDLPKATPGIARIVADAPGRLAIDTLTPARQLLVTTESFDPGWRLTIDGQERPVVRVDGDFLGCVVEAGWRRVRFEFRPASLWYGAVVAACGLQLMVCLFAFRGSQIWRAAKS